LNVAYLVLSLVHVQNNGNYCKKYCKNQYKLKIK
jgi:hypothetical protein